MVEIRVGIIGYGKVVRAVHNVHQVFRRALGSTLGA
jgi:hypothetical protein